MARGAILKAVRAVLATLSIKDGQFRERLVSLSDVVERSGCPRRPVLRCLDRLCREGWLRLEEEAKIPAVKLGETYGPKRREPTFRIIQDLRLHRAHQVGKSARITCRDKIWGTMRAIRSSTLSNLERLTGCDNETCREYLQVLKRNSYVRIAGKSGRENVWTLIKDAGPRRPETTQDGRA